MGLKNIFARIKGVTKEEVITEGSESVTLNIRQTFFSSTYLAVAKKQVWDAPVDKAFSSNVVESTAYGILPNNIEQGRAAAKKLLKA